MTISFEGSGFMSLNQAIVSGQEHRMPYHGAKAVDSACRNHGSCSYCRNNRLHHIYKKQSAMDYRLKEYTH